MSFPRYPAYKDSGVVWLGQIPSHWSVAPLKSVVSCNDEVLVESTPEDFEIEYVEISGVDVGKGIVETSTLPFKAAASRARRVVRDGDVLVSTVRTYLRAIAPVRKPAPNLIASTGFAVLRPKQIESAYLGYTCQAEHWISEVIARSVGVSYPAINASDLVALTIGLPPQGEQAAIAGFLDRETAKIDALVAEQEQLITLLKEKRQAVISHAVTKGLDPSVPMKDSGVEWLGEVPAHWHMLPLKRVSPSQTVGIVVNPSTYVCEDGLPFIYGGDIADGVVHYEGARRISAELSDSQPKTRLSAGDLVTVRVGAPGVTAVVPPECEGGNCASVMLIRRGNFNSAWLCFLMNSRVVRYQVEVVQYGAAQEQFNIAHATDFVLPVPPVDEQNAIAEELTSEVGRLKELEKEAATVIRLLQERRSALISAAVTGQIDVRGLANPVAP